MSGSMLKRATVAVVMAAAAGLASVPAATPAQAVAGPAMLGQPLVCPSSAGFGYSDIRVSRWVKLREVPFKSGRTTGDAKLCVYKGQEVFKSQCFLFWCGTDSEWRQEAWVFISRSGKTVHYTTSVRSSQGSGTYSYVKRNARYIADGGIFRHGSDHETTKFWYKVGKRTYRAAVTLRRP